jgi:hypothetical protein
VVTTLGGGQNTFDDDRLGRREIAQIFIGALLAHELVQTHRPHDRDRAALGISEASLPLNSGFSKSSSD